jgi:succinate dehydrogenase / fumarate reductase, iron-sulfur subunit
MASKKRRCKGKITTYQISDVDPDMSFLEMLDVLNEGLGR